MARFCRWWGKAIEARVRSAFQNPESIERFGGWSLGESSHLINDANVLDREHLPSPCWVFVEGGRRTLTLPVWVDHVGAAATRYVVGELEEHTNMPPAERLPKIEKNA